MGPGLIFDKSAFQALGPEEHAAVRSLFTVGLPPILTHEILADLAKLTRDRPGEQLVTMLARKFAGSTPMVVVNYAEVARESLLGKEPPLTGQLLIGHAESVATSFGPGAVVDFHPINEAIERWRAGRFGDDERVFAERWRSRTDLSLSKFKRHLLRGGVILRRALNDEDARAAAVEELKRRSIQHVLHAWLMDALRLTPSQTTLARARLRESSGFILDAAPYAAFCLGVFLLYEILVRSKLVPQRETDGFDLRYLCHQPTSVVLVSGDRLHRRIGPLVARHPVNFVSLDDFRADLGALRSKDSGTPGMNFPLNVLAAHLAKVPASPIARAWVEVGWDPHRPPSPPESPESARRREVMTKELLAQFREAQAARSPLTSPKR